MKRKLKKSEEGTSTAHFTNDTVSVPENDHVSNVSLQGKAMQMGAGMLNFSVENYMYSMEWINDGDNAGVLFAMI